MRQSGVRGCVVVPCETLGGAGAGGGGAVLRGAMRSWRRRLVGEPRVGGVSADSASAAVAGDAVSVYFYGEVVAEEGGGVGL